MAEKFQNETRIGSPEMDALGCFFRGEAVLTSVDFSSPIRAISSGVVPARGGLVAKSNASSSCRKIAGLGTILSRPSPTNPNIYLLSLEGGSLIVRPQGGASLTEDHLMTIVDYTSIRVGGVISSEQEIICGLADASTVVFERTIIDPEQLAQAVYNLGKCYGNFRVVGPPEGANFIVSINGTERKFMSGIFATPVSPPPDEPQLVLSTDQFGRLSPEFVTTPGYIQQFVEIPWPMPEPPRTTKWGPDNPCYIEK